MIAKYLYHDIMVKALQEDIGSGDLTSGNIFPENHYSKAVIRVKQNAVLCGVTVAREVFKYLSSDIEFTALNNDGDRILAGSVVAEIQGPTALLLSGERVALNFLQHLSGVATMTMSYVEQVKNYEVKIVDTRKTLPGMRVLEKYAVRVGGGTNHRLGLFDSVMIKDNHIKAAGSIRQAVDLARKSIPFMTPIEVESSSVAVALEALAAGADVIMLDNMKNMDMKKAVELIDKKAIVEASGGISFERLQEIAQTGVDVISVGALTHSVPAIDISMKIS